VVEDEDLQWVVDEDLQWVVGEEFRSVAVDEDDFGVPIRIN